MFLHLGCLKNRLSPDAKSQCSPLRRPFRAYHIFKHTQCHIIPLAISYVSSNLPTISSIYLSIYIYIYPLVNWQIGVGRLVSIKNWWFSGSMFIYQRVYIHIRWYLMLFDANFPGEIHRTSAEAQHFTKKWRAAIAKRPGGTGAGSGTETSGAGAAWVIECGLGKLMG